MDQSEISITNDIAQIVLPAILDFGQTESLIDGLHQAITASTDIEIHCEKVERVSTGPIQALLVAAKEAENKKLDFNIKAPTDSFIHAMEELGFADELKRWSE